MLYLLYSFGDGITSNKGGLKSVVFITKTGLNGEDLDSWPYSHPQKTHPRKVSVVFTQLLCTLYVLENSCSQSDREEGQLQHIQHLLETLPPYRYRLVKHLIAYLVRYIEREQISMRDISLINDESLVC